MIQFLIALVILGAALYLLQLLPIDATVKQIIQVIVIVVIVIYAIKIAAAIAGLH
jgi:hypothetical protein